MAKRPVGTPQQRAEFRRQASMPWLWQMEAHSLIAAANILWQKYEARSRATFPAPPRRAQRRWYAGDVQPWAAMMLDGCAVENLSKGILLAQGANAEQGGRLDQQLKTHNLTALCTRAGFTLSRAEEELLERTRRMLELGRYPVGADATMDHQLMLALPRDRNTMRGIVRRVDTEFKRVARASVNDNIEKLGVRVKRISAEERMRRIAMLHGENLDGTPI